MQDRRRFTSSLSAVESDLDGRSERRMLFRMLAAALVLRVALGSSIDASGFDTDLMQSWTRTLLNAPLDQFYAVAEGPDHLPGDLWFLWLIGHGLELLGFNNAPRGPFVALIKFVPAVADTVIAWELFVLVRRFATSRAALIVAGAFAFNPGGIFLTSVWGQWDALSMALLLGGALIVLQATLPLGSGSRQPEAREEPVQSTAWESPREALGVADARPNASMSASPAHGLRAQMGSDPAGRRRGCWDSLQAIAQQSSGRGPSSIRSFGMTAREALGGAADVPRPERRLGPLARRRLRRGILRFAQDDIGERSRGQGQTGPHGAKWTIPLWLLAVPLFTWAVLIKPPLAMVASVFLLYACVRAFQESPSAGTAVGRTALALVASLVLGIATASLLLLPFDVGLPGIPRRWMVLERAQYALDLYPFTTLQAANIWMIKDAHLYRPSDLDGTLFGLTERTWGSLLLALALAWIAGVVILQWCRGPQPTPVVRRLAPLVIWAALATSYAIFMLPTRVHERYFFPVMVFALALAGLRRHPLAEWAGRESADAASAKRQGGVPYDRAALAGNRWTWRLALAISGVFLVSLLIAYTPTVNAIRAALFDVPLSVLFRTLAIVNLGGFLVTMTLPLWWGRRNGSTVLG